MAKTSHWATKWTSELHPVEKRKAQALSANYRREVDLHFDQAQNVTDFIVSDSKSSANWRIPGAATVHHQLPIPTRSPLAN